MLIQTNFSMLQTSQSFLKGVVGTLGFLQPASSKCFLPKINKQIWLKCTFNFATKEKIY